MILAFFACSTSGSVIIDSDKVQDRNDTAWVDDSGLISDTGIVDTAVVDTNDPTDTDTNNPDTGTSDTGTTDTGTTDTGTTDTGSSGLPTDVNNPNIYPNYWYGVRNFDFGNCTGTVEGIGQEVTADYPEWLAQCDCDEIYYVQAQQATVCNYPVQVYYYRGVKYDGQDIHIRYWPNNPAYPVPATTLATGTYSAADDGYHYTYAGQGYSTDGYVNFYE